MKKIAMFFLKNILVMIGMFISMNALQAANRNTIATGNWSALSTWNNAGTNAVPTKDDNVTVDHTVNLDANWGPQNSGSIIFNSTSSGSGTLNMSGGTLDIRANVTLTGTGVNLTGGTIYVRSGYTFTIPGFSQANTNIVVESGATLIVNGDLLENHGNIQVDGLITVIGNYKGQANDAIVVGNGNITSTGSMIGINNSSIFGTANPNCPSNCDGRNLFGGGNNCNGIATAIPSLATICLGNAVSFTSDLAGRYNVGNPNQQPLVYQWQIKNSSNLFVNIPGATLSTYSASPSVSSVYRVIIGDKQNAGDPYCYKYSPNVPITVSTTCVKTWLGGTLGNPNNWHTSSNWSPSGVPVSTDNIVIPVSTNYPVIASGNIANVKNVTINSGATLNIAANNTLNVYGNFSNSGTVNTVAGSTIAMNGSTAQTISGVPVVHNLIINNINGSGVSLSSPIVVNGSLSLVSGILTTSDHLTINFDAGGNIAYNVSDAGSISGNVTGTRNLVAKTHYIATPFGGITTSQINATTPVYRNGSWLLATKDYNFQSWNYVKDSTTRSVIPAVGYSLAMFNPAALTFTGTYNHSSTYGSGNYINDVPPSTRKMYFMMGNPYPSTLDWDNSSGWIKNNINDAIYFWNPVTSSVSSYVNGVGTNGATQYIPAMQSFLVTVTGTGGTSSLMVNNNARVLTNASYFRNSSSELVRLSVKNASGNSVDETVIRVDDLSTSDYDSDADAYKVKGLLSLYTNNTGSATEYSINTLPLSGPEMIVPLNLRVAANGLYTIECKEYTVPGYSLILEDKQTQSYTLLDNSTIYTLNATTKDSVNRFVLRFVAGLTTGVKSGMSSELQISTYDNQMMLNVSGISSSDATINVYDASGLSVMRFEHQDIAPGISTVGLPGLAGGVYIVKVDLNGATYVGKVVLK